MPQKKILPFFLTPTKFITVLTFFLTDKFLLQTVHESEITWSDHMPVSISLGGGWGQEQTDGDAVLMAHPEHKHQIQKALQDFF